MATALLEKQAVQRPDAAEGETGPVLYHWTVERFYRAANANVFDDPGRLEVIQGRIMQKMPTGPLHTTISYDLAERLRETFGVGYLVREERAIHIALDGEPIPDIAVVRGKSSDYRAGHPTPDKVSLLIEVSVTSVEYDLGEKALLYAQAGVADYWVVLVNESAIVRHRIPAPEGYQEATRLSGADPLSPLAMPGAAWTVNALLGRREAPEEN